MGVPAGSAERRPAVAAALAAGAVALLGLTAAMGRADIGTWAAAAVLLGAAAVYRPKLEWRHGLAALLLVILFIPIRRYTIPLDLSFQLEPYRVLVGLLGVAWLLSLLVDPRVRLRKSGLDGPLFLAVLAVLGSVAVNGERVSELTLEVRKAVMFFFTFIVVFYLVVSIVRRLEDIDLLAKILVGGGAIIAVLAMVESRTGLSPFDHMSEFLPFLQPGLESTLTRGAHHRAFGPAEHPIALGAALVMLIPLSVYLAATRRQHRWWIALGLLTLGALATLSRTGVLMLVVVAFAFLWLRPRQTRRMWPVALVLLVATHFVMPGTLGTLRASFFPEEGLLAQQKASHRWGCSSARLADIGPSLAEAAKKPLLGYGYGTRIVTEPPPGMDGPKPNACILDNQWLTTLLETGALGVVGWFWLFARYVRRVGREAKGDLSDRGWLLAALAAAIAGFAVGMTTFDAFSFIQVTFLLVIQLALGAVALSVARRPPVALAD